MTARFSHWRKSMVGFVRTSETYLALENDFLLKFGATNLSFSRPLTPLC
jgi:hypothetical protein